jgi:hypothetical protein
VDAKALSLSDMFHEQSMSLPMFCKVPHFIHSSLLEFQAHKIRASMYDRKFVEIVLSLIGQHCPDVSGALFCLPGC